MSETENPPVVPDEPKEKTSEQEESNPENPPVVSDEPKEKSPEQAESNPENPPVVSDEPKEKTPEQEESNPENPPVISDEPKEKTPEQVESNPENPPVVSDVPKEKLPEQEESNPEHPPRISTFRPPKRRRTCRQTNENMLKERLIADAIYDWKLIHHEDLYAKYAKIYPKSKGDDYLAKLESEVEYMSPELSKVQVFGKWHEIPRKQVGTKTSFSGVGCRIRDVGDLSLNVAAYGDNGLTYKFSGNTVAAKPWSCSPTIIELKKFAESATGEFFNFVLVNRYKDGNDYMGEHRDDEKDLVFNSSIASFSFGQARDFLFRHKDNRGKNSKRPDIPNFKQNLESGSLLIMFPPTNQFWYHSLPVRKNAPGVRVNLTFRRMVMRKIPL